MKQQVGVIGLAVMGKNLALNIADHGFSVSVYNRSWDKTKELTDSASDKNIVGCQTLEEFTASLETPRKIILMVKAGDAVDDTIAQLTGLLSAGDIIMDGGNSNYHDTIRRDQTLSEKGLLYLGTGISGGEEGARFGPAIMPGGSRNAYASMENILTSISAKVQDEPCCTYIGENGSGHFVKMVHNGIEYADMQLICEAYVILKEVLHLSPQELHQVFDAWNQGELSSYLIDITANIFQKKDDLTDNYLVDMIQDVAGQKGTGKWTGQIALDLGVPIPTITNAVFERYLSSMKQERVNASQKLTGPSISEPEKANFIEAVRKALYASKICAYAQGFSLLETASRQYEWSLQLGNIAKIFRGGCIIRAQFLDRITTSYQQDPALPNLLMADYFREIINDYQDDWRKVIITAISSGISVPAFTSALSYYDSYRQAELPMNLLQAQRDYFGAHTYERKDREGVFHTQW